MLYLASNDVGENYCFYVVSIYKQNPVAVLLLLPKLQLLLQKIAGLCIMENVELIW